MRIHCWYRICLEETVFLQILSTLLIFGLENIRKASLCVRSWRRTHAKDSMVSASVELQIGSLILVLIPAAPGQHIHWLYFSPPSGCGRLLPCVLHHSFMCLMFRQALEPKQDAFPGQEAAVMIDRRWHYISRRDRGPPCKEALDQDNHHL